MVQGLTNLRTLNIFDTSIKDLSPLKGMTTLKHIAVGPMVTAKDFSQVFACPLNRLGILGCPIKDISFMTNFPALTILSIREMPVKDLSPLRGLQLESIEMVNTLVRDLSPLEGMPLHTLRIFNVPAANLNVLAGTPLKNVYLKYPDLIMDLSFLTGKDLYTLELAAKIKAFVPLKQVQFSVDPGIACQLRLDFDWIKVPDAEKLPEYVPTLESLCIPSPGKAEAEIVQKFPNLRKVEIRVLNSTTVSATMTFDEFKKKFGRKGKEEKEDMKSAKPK